MKFSISDEYGTFLPFSTDIYDTACRVAHYVRKLGNFDCHVVLAGRAISETFLQHAEKDFWAKKVAKELLDGDFESGLIS